MIKMAEQIADKITCIVPSKVEEKDFNIYFTDKRIVGEFLGGRGLAFLGGGVVGERIAGRQHEKKGEELMEEKRTTDQILTSNEKNFFIYYEEIVSAKVKKKECMMKLAEKKQQVPNFGKRVFFKYGKGNKDKFAAILMKVIPDKVVIK